MPLSEATGARSRPRAFWTRAFGEIDGASLAFFRIAFGLVMVWEVLRYFSYGWIKRYYIDPTYFFTYTVKIARLSHSITGRNTPPLIRVRPVPSGGDPA